MKYFNIACWKNDDPDDAAGKAYRQYIATIRHLMPPDLQRLCDFSPGWDKDRISLNDGSIHAINVSLPNASVDVIIDGNAQDGTHRNFWNRLFYLRYRDVLSFDSMTDPSGSLAGPGGYGDHGFNEIELLSTGLFEHRMLFSSGIELRVVFRQFQLTIQDKRPDNDSHS